MFLPVAFMVAKTINAYVRMKMYCVIRVRLIMRSMQMIKTIRMPLIAAPFPNIYFGFIHDFTAFDIMIKRIDALCIELTLVFALLAAMSVGGYANLQKSYSRLGKPSKKLFPSTSRYGLKFFKPT